MFEMGDRVVIVNYDTACQCGKVHHRYNGLTGRVRHPISGLAKYVVIDLDDDPSSSWWIRENGFMAKPHELRRLPR